MPAPITMPTMIETESNRLNSRRGAAVSAGESCLIIVTRWFGYIGGLTADLRHGGFKVGEYSIVQPIATHSHMLCDYMPRSDMQQHRLQAVDFTGRLSSPMPSPAIEMNPYVARNLSGLKAPPGGEKKHTGERLAEISPAVFGGLPALPSRV
jgi:hypothetical protein